MTTPRPRVTRDDYVTLTLRLAAQGHVPADLSLDDLLSHMKVTRGSFYYHFASMDELHREVLARWRRATSSDAIETAMRDSAMRVVRDPLERLQLLREWAQGTVARDRAIRRWAERTGPAAEAAEAAVAEADGAVTAHARQALLDLGYGNDDAHVLALLITRAFTSEDITSEGFKRLLGILGRVVPQRAAGKDVGVAAGAGGELILYDPGGDPEGRGELAQQFAADHEPGNAAGGPARRRPRRAPAPGG